MLNGLTIYNSAEPTTNEEEVGRFFKALGAGSRLDLADPPAEDDDAAYEKSSDVNDFYPDYEVFCSPFLEFNFDYSNFIIYSPPSPCIGSVTSQGLSKWTKLERSHSSEKCSSLR